MTTPGGRIEIAVEPDLRGFPRRLRNDLTAAAVQAANQGEAAGKGYGDRFAAAGTKGADQLAVGVQGKLRASRGQLATEAEKLAAGMGDGFERGGEESGGLLAQGVRSGIVRNSPLIVAAIAGALAAGAPLALAGATALFAGVGIVAAAQSERVQSTWLGTWQQIKAGAIADAAVIEPTLVRVANNVGAAFERMRPRLQGAFADAAPQIEVFTNGVLGLAENALPGLERAIERGMPVTQALASFLEDTGTGLTGFFDNISAHAPEAGQALDALGDIVGELLPLLGTTFGQGAELAAVALPLLANGLGVVNAAARVLGPALPPLAAGFLALKAAQAVGGWVGGLGGQLDSLAAKGGIAAGATGRVGGALGAVSRAAGPVAIAVGVVAAAMAVASSETDAWVQALLKGGSAARQAQQEAAAKSTDDFVVIGQWLGLVDTFEDVKRKADEYRASLSPLERANMDVTRAQNLLNEKIEEFGPGSNEAEGAARALKSAQGELERQNADLEQAIQGVTQAMLDQAAQARGAIDADFAYENALDQLEDKQRAFSDAIRKHGRASEEASDAQRAYAEGIWETAQAAANADPMLDGLEQGTAEYQRAVDNLTLKSLVDMRAGLGPQMQVVVDGMIAKLQAGGASLDELGQKRPTPVVDADTGPLITKAQMGQQILDALDGRRPLPGLDLNTGPFDGKTQTSFGLLDVLNGKRPLPVAGLNSAPLEGTTQRSFGLLDVLGGRVATPTANLNDQASGPIAGIGAGLAGLRDKTITVTTIQQTVVRAATAVGNTLNRIGLAGGGLLRGPGTGTSDSIPLWGSNGEYMHRAAVVSAVTVPGMDEINRGDWAAAAARFTAMAERQQRSVLASMAGGSAAAAAGRYAAGGHITGRARQLSGGGAGPAVDQRRYSYTLTAAPSLPTIDQLDRMQRKAEVLADA